MSTTGWGKYRLDEIAIIQGGGTPKRAETSYFGGDIPWVTPSDLPNIGVVSELNSTKETITAAGLSSSSAKIIPSGSVLFSSRASVGKIAITSKECATNQGFANFTPKPDKVDHWFLAFLLRRFTPEIVSLAGKTTFLEVPRGKLKGFSVVLPSLDEQRRIVARIKECMERVEEIEGLRAKASEESVAIYPSRCHDFLARKEKIGSWRPVSVGDIADLIQYGYTQSATKSPVGPRFLRITDIQNHAVNWETVPYCEAASKQTAKYELKKNDILFARTGATTGKSFLIETEPPLSIFASYLIRLQINEKVVLPRLVYHFFQSPLYWDQIRQNMRGGAQPNINSKVLASIKLNIPSQIRDQQEIVDRLDEVFILTMELASAQKNQAEAIGCMRESIFRMAFAGEL